METLQSTIFIEFDVNTKKITFLRGDNVIDYDSNATSIYVRVKYKNLSGNTVYLTPSELEDYKFSLYTIKPATSNVNVITGKVTDELKENVYGGVVKFEIPRACTNRLGIVKCEIHINQGNKIIASSTFVLDVKQSLVTAFDDELLGDEDFPVLKQLILEIQKASNIDDYNRSKITSYSSDKIENIKKDLDSQIKEKANKNDLEVQKTRIDSFTTLAAGSTTGDAELIDGRIGADGYVYNNIGDSIRNQINDLNDGNVATKVINSINLFNKDTITTGKYYMSGSEVEDSRFFYSELIEIDKTKAYSFYGIFTNLEQISIFDRNGNYLFGRYMSDLTNSFPGYSYDFAKLSDRDFYGKIKYIRVSGTIDSLDKYMFVEGSTYPESYIPYSATYEIVGKIRKGVEALSKMLIEENCFPIGYTLINEALNNIAIGKNAMKNATTDNGAYNVAIGDNSLVNNTGDGTDDTGNYNVAIGYAAMKNNTTGNHNTAVGFQALTTNTTGVGVIALGEDACFNNTTGNGNTGVGRYSMFLTTTGSNNTAIGLQSLYSNISGENNVAVGRRAGTDHTGDNSTFIGNYSNCNAGLNNVICIGANTYAKEDNQMILGNNAITSVKIAGKTINFNADGSVTWSD